MEADQALVHQILTAHGYMIHTERSAEEALVWLADHRPDVILLDIGLPGMDGLSFAKRIKGQVETASIPVVAVTGEARPGTEEEVAASGCAAYLIKPISVARLLATLEAVSEGKPDDDGSAVPWRLDR
jgi:CheY-like chemotaxis protein